MATVKKKKLNTPAVAEQREPAAHFIQSITLFPQYYCKQALASWRQRRDGVTRCSSSQRVYQADTDEHKTSMENIIVENDDGMQKETYFFSTFF